MRKRVLKPVSIDTKTEFKEGFDGIADPNLRKVLVSLYVQQKKNDLKLEKIVNFCEYIRPSASKLKAFLFKGKNKEVMEKTKMCQYCFEEIKENEKIKHYCLFG